MKRMKSIRSVLPVVLGMVVLLVALVAFALVSHGADDPAATATEGRCGGGDPPTSAIGECVRSARSCDAARACFKEP